MRGISALKTGMALVGVCLLGTAACQPADTGTDTNEQNVAEDAAPALPLPVAEKPLDRSALLIAAAKAGSATALGADDLADQRDLDGKTFEVKIRFGCVSDADQADQKKTGPFNVRFDPKDRTLRVRAAPDLTLDTPQVALEDVEHVEGFWMRRPWLLAPGCPRGSPASDGDAPAKFEQRVGIAQLSTSADDRTVRRDGRPYEATKVLEEGALPSAQGYDLVLSGRVKKLPDGRVIACRVSGIDAPPECVISAQFDRVRIQTPDGKTTLGEWRR